MSNTSITIEEDITSVSISSDIPTSVSIQDSTTAVALSATIPSTARTAEGLVVTPHNTVTATNVQDALEQLADQFFRSASAPTGANLAEGDLWYDTDDDQLKVYRETSTNNFEFVPLAAATDTMDTLDGGLF